jgi:AcrR family transcriptional regulator
MASTPKASTSPSGVKPKRSSPGRPRLEDAASIESKLLGIALNEFLQHGYGGTSMAKIVQIAGMSKTTLYSRYPSKEDLFRAIIHQQIEYLAPSASLKSDAGPLDLEQGLNSYANHMLETSLQGDLLGVNRLIYSESHRFPELGAAVAERTALGIKRISAFIRDCAKRDGISCKDPDAVAEVFILTIRGWYINNLLTNHEVTSRQRQSWVKRAVNTLIAAREDW